MKVETFEQGEKETFQSYKDRVLTLKHKSRNTKKTKGKEKEEDESYDQRIHFLGGLKNINLKNLAKQTKKIHWKN